MIKWSDSRVSKGSFGLLVTPSQATKSRGIAKKKNAAGVSLARFMPIQPFIAMGGKSGSPVVGLKTVSLLVRLVSDNLAEQKLSNGGACSKKVVAVLFCMRLLSVEKSIAFDSLRLCGFP